MSLWQEIGVSSGNAILILIALYFVIKWAVKNGIKGAYKDISGKETFDEMNNNNSELDKEDE